MKPLCGSSRDCPINVVMDPSDVRKSILIIKAQPKSNPAVESFLRNREWKIQSTTNMKEALTYLVAQKPSFVLIAADHPNKKIRMLPKLLKQSFPVFVMAFTEANNSAAYKMLLNSGCAYRINPPMTGPAVERMINKILRDQEEEKEKAKNPRAAVANHAGSPPGGKNPGGPVHLQGEGGSFNAPVSAGELLKGLSDEQGDEGEDIASLSGLLAGLAKSNDAGTAGFGHEAKALRAGDLAGGDGEASQDASNLAYFPDGTARFNPDGSPRLGADGKPLRYQPDGKPARFHADGTPIRRGKNGRPLRPRADGSYDDAEEMNSEEAAAFEAKALSLAQAASEEASEETLDDSEAAAFASGVASSGGIDGTEGATRATGLAPKMGASSSDGDPSMEPGSLATAGGKARSWRDGPEHQGDEAPNVPGELAARNLNHGPKGETHVDLSTEGRTEAGILKPGARKHGEHGGSTAGDEEAPTASLHREVQKVRSAKPKQLAPDNVMVRGTQAALDESVKIGDGVVNERLERSSNVACLIIESPKFSGYLIAALGKNRYMDENFVKVINDRLLKFLRDNGEPAKDEGTMGIRIKPVDFEDWALESAEFLRKSVHNGEEIAMAFFPFTAAKTELEESAAVEMGAVKIDELRGDIKVEFNLYIYLAANKKYILYTPRGGTFYANQKGRLAEMGVKHLHVKRTELQDVSRYRAQNYLNDKIDDFESQAPAKPLGKKAG